MALALLLHGQKSLFGFENGHMKQKALHKVYINSAKFWGIKIEIYLTTEVPMGINIDQPGVQRNRYQMTPSTVLWVECRISIKTHSGMPSILIIVLLIWMMFY